jgi:hypothetical protein
MGEMTAEDRELYRLQRLATHARDVLGTVDVAISNAMVAKDVQTASSYLRGNAATFARALLALVELA